MKKLRVYVDTSVIGGYFDQEFEEWSKHLVEDFRQGLYVPVFSEIVVSEIQLAPQQVQSLYSELSVLRSEILIVNELWLKWMCWSVGILSILSVMTKFVLLTLSIWNWDIKSYKFTHHGRLSVMDKISIDTMEMVRTIRDQHADMLKGKSHQEIIEFFHRQPNVLSQIIQHNKSFYDPKK